MKKLLAVLFVATTAILYTSCTKVVGEGPVVTETRAVSNFTGISSGMSGQVNFTIGPVFKVEVKAQRNILDVLRTYVSNGVLEIDFKNNVHVSAHEVIVVNITAPTANFLRLSGSGNMDVQGDLVTNNLELNISGSGNITVQNAWVAEKINARISGSGDMKILTGAAKNEDLTISGSGSLNFSGVGAENAITQISGSGNIKVDLLHTLDAHISGSGSVYYHGNPIISAHISGSGKVLPF